VRRRVGFAETTSSSSPRASQPERGAQGWAPRRPRVRFASGQRAAPPPSRRGLGRRAASAGSGSDGCSTAGAG
jgi:hypothetical protein